MAKANARTEIDLEKIAYSYKNEVVVEWGGTSFTITPTLTLQGMLKFVDSVVKSCFEQGSGAFLPEAKDFAIRSNLVDTYTEIILPSNLEAQYDILHRTDIVDVILANINMVQFNEMIAAIEAKIDYYASSDVQAMQRQVYDAIASVRESVNQFTSILDSATGLDIAAMIRSVMSGEDAGKTPELRLVDDNVGD